MGKFYWLKLHKDFFNKYKMISLRALENGMVYEAALIHMMAESISHNGYLRFSDSKPYDARKLAALVGTTEAVMKEALEAFIDLELIEVLEDGTIYIPYAYENIGYMEDNANANRQRKYREKVAAEKSLERYEGVTNALQNVTPSVTECNTERYTTVTKDNESIEIRDKSKDIRDIKERNIKERKPEAIDKSIAPIPEKRTRFVKPSVEEIAAYCKDRGNGVDAQRFFDFYEGKGWKVGNTPMKDWRACVRTWERREQGAEKKGGAKEIPYMQKEYDFEEMEKDAQADLLAFLADDD